MDLATPSPLLVPADDTPAAKMDNIMSYMQIMDSMVTRSPPPQPNFTKGHFYSADIDGKEDTDIVPAGSDNEQDEDFVPRVDNEQPQIVALYPIGPDTSIVALKKIITEVRATLATVAILVTRLNVPSRIELSPADVEAAIQLFIRDTFGLRARQRAIALIQYVNNNTISTVDSRFGERATISTQNEKQPAQLRRFFATLATFSRSIYHTSSIYSDNRKSVVAVNLYSSYQELLQMRVQAYKKSRNALQRFLESTRKVLATGRGVATIVHEHRLGATYLSPLIEAVPSSARRSILQDSALLEFAQIKIPVAQPAVEQETAAVAPVVVPNPVAISPPVVPVIAPAPQAESGKELDSDTWDYVKDILRYIETEVASPANDLCDECIDDLGDLVRISMETREETEGTIIFIYHLCKDDESLEKAWLLETMQNVWAPNQQICAARRAGYLGELKYNHVPELLGTIEENLESLGQELRENTKKITREDILQTVLHNEEVAECLRMEMLMY
ncbi:uncharacterized protein BP5553_10071 [Venustampulla echinocandica]|uniref:Uncharacterized protein n=1 Tax=Venustampulla echinocandica TaxID=2656787 RepID=A0A370TA88_9HELO|nr:uncharacterized protein BP5553_10071 [Venustampulla echinocandica]RDL30726.1 hypothetical protein BP5553_10071 [Venustampulla echinocandica]